MCKGFEIQLLEDKEALAPQKLARRLSNISADPADGFSGPGRTTDGVSVLLSCLSREMMEEMAALLMVRYDLSG